MMTSKGRLSLLAAMPLLSSIAIPLPPAVAFANALSLLIKPITITLPNPKMSIDIGLSLPSLSASLLNLTSLAPLFSTPSLRVQPMMLGLPAISLPIKALLDMLGGLIYTSGISMYSYTGLGDKIAVGAPTSLADGSRGRQQIYAVILVARGPDIEALKNTFGVQ